MPHRPIALLLLFAVPFAGACRRSETPSGGDTLAVAARSGITGVFPNPPMEWESFTADINSNVFEGLTALDSQLRPQPALAEKWRNVDDRTWVFTLRRGVRFSDGSPLRPADVVASLREAMRRPFPNRHLFQAVVSVRENEAGEVEIRTRDFYPILLSEAAIAYVLPESALSRDPVPAVGTGPYTIERWQPGGEFVLARNPFYRGPRPFFRRVQFLIEPEAGKREELLLTGRVELADNIPPEDVARLSAMPGIHVASGPGDRVLYLLFRVDRPPFSDPRVRRAVSLALDRAEINRRALAGRASEVAQLVPPSIAGFSPELPQTVPDREAARRLLAEAGASSGLAVELDVPSDKYVNGVLIAREVARQLRQVGLRVSVRPVRKVDFFPLLRSGGSNFLMIGWSFDTLEVSDFLSDLLRTPNGETGPNQNYWGVSDLELDRRIDAANRAPELSERNRLLSEAAARVQELDLAVPLVLEPNAVAESRRITWDPPLGFALRAWEIRPSREFPRPGGH